MYLGIDFLITSDLRPYVVEVNLGLPGGAQEYDLTHQVNFGKPSDIFRRIEETSHQIYGKTFKDYLHTLPFIESLKPFKIWMDGMGPLPDAFHPGLRLEDKWIQYQLISPLVPMPETMIFDPFNLIEAERFLEKKGKIVMKRRLGRGGRDLQVISDRETLRSQGPDSKQKILQEYIGSRIDGHTLSIRSIAFGGEFMCMYSNLSSRATSNHGVLIFVSPGRPFGLAERDFETQSFDQRSWEAQIWFGENEPPYLHHNLYEDEVAKTTLLLPEDIYRLIQERSVKIERFYESLDLSNLPKACFED